MNKDQHQARGKKGAQWFDGPTISRVRWLLEHRHIRKRQMAEMLGVKDSYIDSILTYNSFIYADPIRPEDEWIAELRAGKFTRAAAQTEAA